MEDAIKELQEQIEKLKAQIYVLGFAAFLSLILLVTITVLLIL